MDAPQQTPPINETDEQRDIRLNKDIAAFSYIWILSIAVYVSRRDSAFARFHSKQGVVLFLFTIPIGLIPSVGNYLMLFPLAGMLLGFINAAQGLYRDVPFAGPLSRGEMSITDLVKICVDAVKKLVDVIKRTFRSNAPKTPPPPAVATAVGPATAIASAVAPPASPIPTPSSTPHPNP